MTRFETCLPLLLQHEGGYSDDPQDPGGATNLGVTLATWADWTARHASKDDIKALTVERVAPLYRARYWDAAHCDQLPPGVDYIVFDAAVNSGPGRASRTLQGAVGVDDDGSIGPVTLQALAALGARAAISRFAELRETFYRQQPTFVHFGHGWLNRLGEVKQAALDMVQ